MKYIDTTLTGGNVVERYRKLKSKVVNTLEYHPSTTGKDIILIYYVWRDFYGIRIPFKKFEDLMRLANPYNIIRLRQLINEKGVYVNGELKYYRPTPKTTSKRRALANQLRVEFGKGNI